MAISTPATTKMEATSASAVLRARLGPDGSSGSCALEAMLTTSVLVMVFR